MDEQPLPLSSLRASFSKEAMSNNESHRLDGSDLGSDMTANKPTVAEAQRAAKAAERKEIEEMARRETDNIRVWRLVLMLVMLITGVAVTIGTFFYIRQQQLNEAIQSYNLFTQTVKSASDAKFDDFWKAMSSLSKTITSAGIENTGRFPFVRVPMFEIHASHTRNFCGVAVVVWSPLVLESQRQRWSAFVMEQQGWYDESKYLLEFTSPDENLPSFDLTSTTPSFIWWGSLDLDEGIIETAPPGGPFAPAWQCSPPPSSRALLNYDIMSNKQVFNMQDSLQQLRHGLVGPVDKSLHNGFHSHRYLEGSASRDSDHPHSTYVQPVFEGFDESSKMVGFLSATVSWDFLLDDLLPDGVTGILAVLRNSCNQTYTYRMEGKSAVFLGVGDLHDRKYEHTEFHIPLITHEKDVTANTPGHCGYMFSLYFSDAFKSEEKRNLHVLLSAIIATIFALMAGTFYMYDRMAHNRNTKMVATAANSNAFISTLFPSVVKKRLMDDIDESDSPPGEALSCENDDEDDIDDEIQRAFKSKPIADLYTETTILFADIVDFSAWSSMREPAQVFTLLETLFYSFDEIAKQLQVFKVETIGDCYVAVVGLPEVRPDHAVVMARFARNCMIKLKTITKQLEVTLGPDTGDLSLRMGLHSGPVTAGVLRGQKSRFQLFGDTMNTAARMEQNGVRNKIHISQDTADRLVAGGKAKWVTQREDVVYAKGKGEMKTYWVETKTKNSETSSQVDTSQCSDQAVEIVATKFRNPKTGNMIKWSEDVLIRLLKQVVARRRASPLLSVDMIQPNETRFLPSFDNNPVDEVKDIITLPRFKMINNQEDPENIILDPIVVQQLRQFLTSLADLYRENHFHNFEHAGHVAMSVVKLLSRIVDPVEGKDNNSMGDNEKGSIVHNLTYGIASDPLTQFSCVLAALVHEVHHPGVPNEQLAKEQNELATRFSGKSMVEQNSLNIAWDLLFKKEYEWLRHTIYETDDELQRFRHVLVNSVMASDWNDSGLKLARMQRWERAFSPIALRLSSHEMLNRKATIVIDYLQQASNISHTMQHWQIYRKWNERYFYERHTAFVEGRAERNPADSWYEEEIASFDFYVIPLARKLKDCAVFGVSSDEYLNYAIRNRQDWEKRGRDLVDDMVQQVKLLLT